MRLFIIALLAVMPFFATAQQLYGTGVGYVNGTPTFTPNISQKGSELCVSLNKKMLYLWNRDSSEWKPLGGITVTFGVPVSAPDLVGGTRTAIDMQTGFIYRWDGTSWKEIIATALEQSMDYADAVAELYANEVRAELADSMVVARAYADTLFANITVDSLVKSATLSGFLAANSIPYVDNDGRLNARGFQQFNPQGSAPSAPASGISVFANGASNLAYIRADGFITTFDFSTATGNRFFTYPANAGTFGILENTQTWTGINTFSPSGTGAAGFVYSSTGRPSHPFPTVTTAQMNAMSGMAAGDGVYNSTTKRLNIWDVSWLAVPTMASGGIGNNQVVRGDAAGNLVSSANFTYDGSQLYVGRTTGGQVADFRVNTATPQGVRITQVNSDGRSSINFYDASVSAQVLAARPANGAYAFGTTGLGISEAGVEGSIVQRFGTLAMISTHIGQGQSGAKNLIIAGAGQSTGSVAGYSVFGATAGSFDIGTQNKVSGVAQGVRDSIRVTASSFRFNLSSAPAGPTSVVQAHFNPFFNYFSQPTNFGSTTPPKPVTALDVQTTARGSRPFPGLNTVQIAALSGRVYKLKITGGGTGYGPATPTSVPLTISGGGGTGATGTAMAHNGIISEAFVTNEGSGYTSIPSVSVGGVGSGATIIAETTSLVDGLGVYNTDTKTYQYWESTTSTIRDFGSYQSGKLGVGTLTPHASSVVEMVSNVGGLLIPRATTAQITAVSSPALALQMFSTTDERIHLKRTDGFYQVAYTQDIKRDTAYRTVNANLDLSGLTTTLANRYKRVIVETIVTAAATGNNTITMPVPTAALLGTKFEISVEDTSGDGDISVLSFGTDGTDGHLYNGDGTFSSSQNLFPGLGVYVSVSWCEAKSAYRWKLQ